MAAQSEQPGPTPERAGKTVSEPQNYASPHDEFIFDPEVDDPHLEVLFELTVAGTWQKALEVADAHREITEQQTFWELISKTIERCRNDGLREEMTRHYSIVLQHLNNQLSAEDRSVLSRFPKSLLRGDLARVKQLSAEREAATAAGNIALEKRLLREILAIDPYDTPAWRSLARSEYDSGNETTHHRCMRRFGMSLRAEFDIGLFAFRHGIQKVARSNFESCLSTIAGNESALPQIAITALTALASIYGDLSQHEAAAEYSRRACEVADNCRSEAPQTGEPKQFGFGELERLQLHTNLQFANVRAGRLDEAEDQFEVLLTQITQARFESDSERRSFAAVHARITLGLGEIARRRGEDDRAIVFLVQSIERLGLQVGADGRLSTVEGKPWRADAAMPFADLTSENYPEPKPESLDPHATWFADSYEHLVTLMKAAAGNHRDYPAELDANLLRLAASPHSSTRRGKALSRLGTLLWKLGQLERAEEAHRAALVQYRETESGWSAIADSEQILAEILLATGRPTEAKELIDAAIVHFSDTHDLGAEPEQTCANLAQAHIIRAQVNAKIIPSPNVAERAFILDDVRAAADHVRKAIDYPGAHGTVEDVAVLLVALGAYAEAAELLVSSTRINIAAYPKYVDVSTSPLLVLERTGLPHGLWILLSLVSDGSISKGQFLPEIFAILFGARNLSISAFRNAMKQTVGVSHSLIEALHSVRERIATARMADSMGEATMALVRSERQIMAQLHCETEAHREKTPTVDSIFRSLQRNSNGDEVYIEFVSFTPVSVQLHSEIEFKSGEFRVVAILCAITEGNLSTELFDLGDEEELSALVDFLNRPYLYGRTHRLETDLAIAASMGWKTLWEDDENIVGQMRERSLDRYDSTLRPLVDKISEYSRWNIGVRGQVSKLAFDFLASRSNSPNQRIEIVRDPVLETQSVASARLSSQRGAAAIVIGDPAFGDKRAPASRDGLSLSLNPLPGSRAEAETIAGLFGTRAIVGADATRDLLLSVKNPPILHVATHGFFLRPHQRAELAGAVRNSLSLNGRPANNALARLTRDDPHCHIGLALAGADRWLEDSTESGFNRGIVFGDEIAMINLLETDLVVLSCCDSGLGLGHITHGVINLPRAFLSAGARAVVASLWPLSDEFVLPVMFDFYRYLLDGETIVSALTRAKQNAIAREGPRLVWGALQLYVNPECWRLTRRAEERHGLWSTLKSPRIRPRRRVRGALSSSTYDQMKSPASRRLASRLAIRLLCLLRPAIPTSVTSVPERLILSA